MQSLSLDRGANISSSGDLRWTLWREWDRAKGTVAWLMLNPSTADAEQDDPTLRRCMHFTRRWDYGGLVVVNLYPFRSSSPAICREWADFDAPGRGPDWAARDDMQANLGVVESTARSSHLRVVAFGAGAWDDDWTERCLEAFGQPSDIATDERLFCLGTSKHGAPMHPMARGRNRVADNQLPVVWRV